MADTARSNFLVQAKASLAAVSAFQVVVTDPRNQEFLDLLPACLITNASDPDGGISGFGHDHDWRSQGLIRIYGDTEWETVDMAVELEKLVGDVVAKLRADFAAFLALSPEVVMTDIRVVTDPELEIEQDRSIITIGVEYRSC